MRECESTSDSAKWDQLLRSGQIHEKIVIEYLIKKNFTLLSQRKKIFSTEIDLLFEKEATLYIVEVKSKSVYFEEHLQNRISRKQLKRLINVKGYLENKSNQPVRLVLAFVSLECQFRQVSKYSIAWFNGEEFLFDRAF